MKKIEWMLSLLAALCMLSCGSGEGRERRLFVDDWRFELADVAGAETVDFDDSAWRSLSLPHDWAVEGEFSAENPSGAGGGALPGGVGWYRKSFEWEPEWADKRVYMEFDGAYMNSSVYLNGTLLGTRPYGYVSFRYDITPYLVEGENVVAVRVDNSEQPNSRWYSGCGIYRNVWLTVCDNLHVDNWGMRVTTPQVCDEWAELVVETTIVNHLEEIQRVDVNLTVRDERGRVVAREEGEIAVDDCATHSASIRIDNPERWRLERPYLYTVEAELYTDGTLRDRYSSTTGIRTFRFDVEKGFFLNDESVKINGVCMHHDLGCLGAAVNKRAIERQLQILQQMGCNAIRTSHNPPAPELLELCDRMGFIVMEDTFDMWRKRKTSHDYSRYFDEWHERDLKDMVLRDRNHPSIFMWNIGNEVLEQWTDVKADTLSLAEANLVLNLGKSADMLAKEGEGLSVNSLLTIKLADLVRSLDDRPITAGCNEPNPYNHLFRSGTLDIIGYNYNEEMFLSVPENFPDKPFIITESVSALATRGYYRMPSDKEIICPDRWDIPYTHPSMSCSAYDHCHVPWGTTQEQTLRLVEENDFISGQYIWTGFDYIGEPTPYGFPARSSYFGIVDLAGFPKDSYYMYQSVWRPEETVLHLFPHWNWTEGEEVDLWAYYNNADEVELFLNGRSLGRRSKAEGEYHVWWRVTYEPGELRIISYKGGKEVASRVVRTAGEPAAVRLTADRNVIEADGRDLAFFTVEIVDKEGNVVPTADDLVEFEIEGAGFIAGVDNGLQTSMESFKAPHRKAFSGKCLCVVQSDGNSGRIRLRATSDGLEEEVLTIKAR